MTKQSTIDKLIEMRLTSMSDAFITQMDDPKMKDVPFEDRFGLLVDIEYNNRKSNSLKRLIKGAGFDQPEAYIADIDYTSEYSCAVTPQIRQTGVLPQLSVRYTF